MTNRCPLTPSTHGVHRSHIAASRYARRDALPDMLAKRDKRLCAQLGLVPVSAWTHAGAREAGRS